MLDRLRYFAASLLLGQKMDPTGAVAVGRRRGQPQWTKESYENYANEGYRKNVIVKRCIELVSQSCANIPIQLKKRGAGNKSKWKVIDDYTHPLLQLLDKPNPWQGGDQWREAWFAWVCLWGNVYTIGNGKAEELTPDAPPLELWLPRPDRFTIIPGEDNLPAIYRFKVDERKVDFPCDWATGKSAVLHYKTFNPMDDYYGMPPLRAMAMDVDQHNAAGAWNMSVLQNGGRPSGAIKYAPNGQPGAILALPQRQQLEAQLKDRATGPQNARIPLILDGGLEWQEMGMNAVDLDWLEGSRDCARRIALGMGTPSQLLGIPGDNTYANYEQARLAFYEDTVLPFHERFLDALNGWLVPMFGDDLVLCADTSELPALAPRRKEAWDALNTATFLTTNEKRDRVNLEPIEDPMADEVLVPSSLIPLSQTAAPDPADLTNENAPPGNTKPFQKKHDLFTDEGRKAFVEEMAK